MILLLAITLFVTLFLSKDIEISEKSYPPLKPKNIIKNVFWVGGLDGGVFIHLENAEVESLLYGTIYNDFNGDISYQGRFKTNFLLSSIKIDSVEIYSAWDGETLHLTNDRYLTAIDSFRYLR